MQKKRRFAALKGIRIVEVDESAVNQIILVGNDGNRYIINAELDELHIPHLTMIKEIPD